MEKSVSKASVRKKTSKHAGSARERAETARMSKFIWLARFFNVLCFVLVLTASVLSLSLIHMAKESEVNAVLVTSPMFSENLAYFEPLHPDMPTMDILAEMFVRQYVTTRHNVWPHAREMRFAWGPRGVMGYMSAGNVYEAFWKKEVKKYIRDDDMESPPKTMVDTDIKKIIKEGWNSWQIFFDTRTMDKTTSEPVIEHWIATIQFRYYSANVVMASRLLNPLGFTVTQYNLAATKK